MVPKLAPPSSGRRPGTSRTRRDRCRAGRGKARRRTARRRPYGPPASPPAASSFRTRPAPIPTSAPTQPHGSGTRSASDGPPNWVAAWGRGAWSPATDPPCPPPVRPTVRLAAPHGRRWLNRQRQYLDALTLYKYSDTVSKPVAAANWRDARRRDARAAGSRVRAAGLRAPARRSAPSRRPA